MSAPPRLFQAIPEGESPEEWVLTEGAHHHLTHVLRLEVGARFEIFDGRGNVYPAELRGTSALLSAPQRLPLRTQVTLLQALPKSDKLEWILQKGTEIGASGFVVFPSRRSVARFPEGRVESKAARWKKVLEEAARQCRRADLPTLRIAGSWTEAREQLLPGVRLLLLDEEEKTRSLGAGLERHPPGAPVAIAIGPEGGWERDELASAEREGGLRVTLGDRILRTETAGLAALTVVLHRAGELG